MIRQPPVPGTDSGTGRKNQKNDSTVLTGMNCGNAALLLTRYRAAAARFFREKR